MTHFDIFTIHQWREGYTLEVKITRPRNAPRYKFTDADRKRQLTAVRKNQEYIGYMFTTLDEVFEEIKRLQFPMQAEENTISQEKAQTC